ncbi:hypothetical protein AB0G77_35055 [Streptomyces hygroscopicus]|uniref:hypothetical protein n=1 Tax=Streptomyces hygroscopicus TaxID=1912 RepID=UPI0033C48965
MRSRLAGGLPGRWRESDEALRWAMYGTDHLVPKPRLSAGVDPDRLTARIGSDRSDRF